QRCSACRADRLRLLPRHCQGTEAEIRAGCPVLGLHWRLPAVRPLQRRCRRYSDRRAGFHPGECLTAFPLEKPYRDARSATRTLAWLQAKHLQHSPAGQSEHSRAQLRETFSPAIVTVATLRRAALEWLPVQAARQQSAVHFRETSLLPAATQARPPRL